MIDNSLLYKISKLNNPAIEINENLMYQFTSCNHDHNMKQYDYSLMTKRIISIFVSLFQTSLLVFDFDIAGFIKHGTQNINFLQ